MKQESVDFGMQVAILADFDQEGGASRPPSRGYVMQSAAKALLVYTLIGLGRVVYYYQPPTAGGDAVVATYLAAPPVYHLLDIMRLQSGAVMRGMLLD